MAGKTPTEKIHDLDILVATHKAQLVALQGQVNGIEAVQNTLSDSVVDVKTKLALLDRQLVDLKQGKEEWGRRLWAVVGPILGALVGGLVGYLLHR
jgi:FtsZ-binding cell division protein ZapB